MAGSQPSSVSGRARLLEILSAVRHGAQIHSNWIEPHDARARAAQFDETHFHFGRSRACARINEVAPRNATQAGARARAITHTQSAGKHFCEFGKILHRASSLRARR